MLEEATKPWYNKLLEELSVFILAQVKQMVYARVWAGIQEATDFTLGYLPARYIHPNAAVYPFQFMNHKWAGYKEIRRELAEEQNPEVRRLNAEINNLLQGLNVPMTQLKAEERLNAAKKLVQQRDPEVKRAEEETERFLREKGINPYRLKAHEHWKNAVRSWIESDPAVQHAKAETDQLLQEHGPLLRSYEEEESQRHFISVIMKAQARRQCSTNDRVHTDSEDYPSQPATTVAATATPGITQNQRLIMHPSQQRQASSIPRPRLSSNSRIHIPLPEEQQRNLFPDFFDTIVTSSQQ